jgi:hypothetical protein
MSVLRNRKRSKLRFEPFQGREKCFEICSKPSQKDKNKGRNSVPNPERLVPRRVGTMALAQSVHQLIHGAVGDAGQQVPGSSWQSLKPDGCQLGLPISERKKYSAEQRNRKGSEFHF